jgi:purine-binding chemotaxis protein CheW
MEADKQGGKRLVLISFYLGENLMGLDTLRTQEIIKIGEMTPIHRAPAHVLGLINLRGHIVTILDLGRKLGLAPSRIQAESRVIIVGAGDEFVGLLVDRISEVIEVREEDLLPAPAQVQEVDGRFFRGVCPLEQGLVTILDLDEVLAEKEG